VAWRGDNRLARPLIRCATPPNTATKRQCHKPIRPLGNIPLSFQSFTLPPAVHKNAGLCGCGTVSNSLSSQIIDEGRRRMKMLIAAVLFVGLSATAANAINLAELAPCRPAAARYCDRSGGMTFSNLMRCGATLAAQSWRVSTRCREVLRKYGQL
jgi:hypothetical protein